MPQRTFTPEEANAALAQVRPLVERLVEHRADLLAVQSRHAEVAARVGGNGGGFEPQLGEERVAWWHTLDGGFAGRQPL